jgi:Cu/Ag efflux protein CusF
MIKTIDLKTHKLTLEDGKTFVFPQSWTLHGYKTGEKVTVTYHDQMGTMMVTKISKA